MAKTSDELDTLLEPAAVLEFSGYDAEVLAAVSSAISLKRIADFLTSPDFSKSIFDPNAPTNSYGEGLVDGIQNAIERGQRGIGTYGR